MKLQLTQELIQSIVNYLQTKPYNEVYVLISEIMKQANEQEEPKNEQ